MNPKRNGQGNPLGPPRELDPPKHAPQVGRAVLCAPFAVALETKDRPTTIAAGRGLPALPEAPSSGGRCLRRSKWLLFLALGTAFLSASAAQSPPAAIRLGNRFLTFTINASTGHCEIFDRETQVAWGASDSASPFGNVTLKTAGQSSRVELGRCDLMPPNDQSGATAIFHPITNNPAAALRVHFQILPNQPILQVSYETEPGLEIESISPLAHVVSATDSGKGYLAVPVREGLLIPADSRLSFTHRFDTYAYEGCHMEMLGAVQNESAILATWNDPYTAVDIKSTLAKSNASGPLQQIVASLSLSKSAKSFRLQLLGRGDYVSIAKAYRTIAKDKGLLVTWDQKLKTYPERAKLFGAANIKLWSTLDRRMNEESTKEESVRTNWTFDEAAQVAEHLKKDLQLDRVLFTIGGWIHRGYDNQHPDILPTAPECGGDSAFSGCARRVMQQGYLFCLHDNYQDIYRDSPSWDERFVMKTRDGKPARGGHWAGGLAFLTCSKMALELAERPQNLQAVKKLSNANAYFIDTTYAAGLQECFDPAHPLTRIDDIKWKQALSDYARGVFGVFGSECGREWAIPHSDFFEGLTGVGGRSYHDTNLPDKLGGTVVPLFDLVYRDCIAMYGKYGYDPAQAALYVLQHISLARPLNYHSIPAHLYWKSTQADDLPLGLSPTVDEIVSVGPRNLRATYRWFVQKPTSDNWQIFVHFTDAAGNVKFQNDYRPDPPTSQWKAREVEQGPFTIGVPEDLAGTFDVRMGLFNPDSGRRALLLGRRSRDRDYLVGQLTISNDKTAFQPTNVPSMGRENLDLFTRSDNGWTAGLHETDRFIKNTYEVLSPLNEITARWQMMSHEFLGADRKVQRTVFGQGRAQMIVTVNFGDSEYVCDSKLGGRVRLPSLGFLAESDDFAAFYSRDWNGVEFGVPSLFTLRSLDGRPLSRSRKLRVFHGFGDDKLLLGKNHISVTRDLILDPQTQIKR